MYVAPTTSVQMQIVTHTRDDFHNTPSSSRPITGLSLEKHNMSSRGLHRTALRLACAAIAFILMLTTISSSYAAGIVNFDRAAVVPAGTGAMLQFRVAFGGSIRAGDQASIALAAGPVWRNDGGSLISPNAIFRASAIELGLSLSGQPVAKFGGIDLVNATPIRTAAEGEAGDAEDEGIQRRSTGFTLFLIGMGVLGVIGIAAMVDSVRDNPHWVP
jgi:hypothetical protein